MTFRDVHGVTSSVTLRADEGGSIEEVWPRERQPEAQSGPQLRDETEDRLRVVTAMARQHLPDSAAEDFLALLRPALRLVHAGQGDPVGAQLGGLPTLPINSWPVWEGHGPLHHVLSFYCGPVASMLPELGLPSEGRLAFFYFDGSYDNFESTVRAGCVRRRRRHDVGRRGSAVLPRPRHRQSRRCPIHLAMRMSQTRTQRAIWLLGYDPLGVSLRSMRAQTVVGPGERTPTRPGQLL